MRFHFLPALTMLVIALPATALLTDQEPSNDSISTAAIQITLPLAVNVDGGLLSFAAGGGDVDFVGIGGLFAGDIVTVTTTPLVDPPDFEVPDTIVGLFNSNGVDLCIGDDAFNNDLDNFPTGFGSICRLEIPADGDYFVGVTGFTSVPFDGTHFEEGIYSLTVTALPEPGLLLQLASGLLGLLAIDQRRRCAKG
jgi:hypothetical protein